MAVPSDPDDTGPAPVLVLPEHAAAVFSVLGRRWSPHILCLLGQRPARFSELQRAIPNISPTSLNDRLRDLINEGLVLRTVCSGPPLASSYQTTPLGKQIAEPLIGFAGAPAISGDAPPPRSSQPLPQGSKPITLAPHDLVAGGLSGS
jgi:DNA-binding HxlR family transcriptional regulator